MSTAVAAGMPPAHGGFRASEKGKGKVDPEDTKRDANGLFAEEEEEDGAVREEEEEDEDEDEEEEPLSESSSIGAASSDSSSIGENSAGEEEEEEVESKDMEGLGMLGLGTLESLEEALPSKRGLSNFYAGKSKSFTSLSEASAKEAAKEIAKPENPFNKRRRVLAAWSRRRASCSALATTYLPPLLRPDHTVVEEDDEEAADNSEGDDEAECGGSGRRERRHAPSFPSPRLSSHATMTRGLNPSSSFRSPRSFSMTDLQSASYNLAEN